MVYYEYDNTLWEEETLRKTAPCKMSLFLITLILCTTLVSPLSVLAQTRNPYLKYDLPVPTTSVKPGTYKVDEYKLIKLSNPGKHGKLFYSIGSERNYQEYKEPIKLNRSAKLYAYIYDGDASRASETVVFEYKLVVKKVYVSIDSGTYEGTQIVKLSSPSSDVSFFYTTNGKEPDIFSKEYTDKGIKLLNGCTLRVYVWKPGFTPKTFKKKYVITYNESTPDISKYEGGNITDLDITEGYDIYGKSFAERPLYASLSKTKKKLYEFFYRTCANYKASDQIDVNKMMTDDELYDLYFLMKNDSPELFWIHSSTIYSSVRLKPTYTCTQEEANERFSLMETKADEILSSIPTNAGDYEKVKYIHDWLAKNVEYNFVNGEPGDKHTAYDVILDRLGICSGYANAFCYLCRKCGIPCTYVGGEATYSSNFTDRHAWNKVKIDGNWYNVDVTWDDPTYSDGTINTTPKYTYFCITDEEIGRNHTPDPQYNIDDLKCTKTCPYRP